MHPASLLPSEDAESTVRARIRCFARPQTTGAVTDVDVLTREDEVVLTAHLEPVDGAANCPDNDETPYTVVLDEPLGGRRLADGNCYAEGYRSRSCAEFPVRWEP